MHQLNWNGANPVRTAPENFVVLKYVCKIGIDSANGEEVL